MNRSLQTFKKLKIIENTFFQPKKTQFTPFKTYFVYKIDL